jgi:hypothetical protein
MTHRVHTLTPSDSLASHWDCLFGAVCERLRAQASALPASCGADAGRDAADPSLLQLRDTVLDCVSALEQLHAARGRLIERGERCGLPCCVRCRTDAAGRRA